MRPRVARFGITVVTVGLLAAGTTGCGAGATRTSPAGTAAAIGEGTSGTPGGTGAPAPGSTRTLGAGAPSITATSPGGATGAATGRSGTAAGTSGSVPTVASLGRLTASGPVTARSGQRISGLRISNPRGTCIVVPAGVTGVTITGNEIGPCGTALGQDGVEIGTGAGSITVSRNVIHDVSTGLSAREARHPLVMEKNRVYDVRGPYPAGQMVQFNSVRGGSGQSRIVGNISDKNAAGSATHYEDHISMYKSSGSSGAPILIACNKVRGKDSQTGTGIMVGDNGGSWFDIRDNVVVGTGLGVAGGHHVSLTGNVVFTKGSSVWFAIFDYAGEVPMDVTLTRNRGAAYYVPQGGSREVLGEGLFDDGSGSSLRYVGNTWRDASVTSAIWGTTPAGCS